MSNRVPKEGIKKLNKVRDDLLKFSHHPKCPHPYTECPADHVRCNYNLDYISAILWNIGWRLNRFLEYKGTRAFSRKVYYLICSNLYIIDLCLSYHNISIDKKGRHNKGKELLLKAKYTLEYYIPWNLST